MTFGEAQRQSASRGDAKNVRQNQNRPLACLDEEALKDITAPANLNSAVADMVDFQQGFMLAFQYGKHVFLDVDRWWFAC